MVKTTISISVDLRDRLISEKLTKSETYDEILARLLIKPEVEIQ